MVALVGGVTWTIATQSARLGDAAIVSTLTGVFGWCLYYGFARTGPYSRERVEAPGIVFDYVLYLGCLLLAVDLGYIESRFHPFGADWDHSLLLASAVFVTLAYRFDNRFVLSLALSTLAGWFGVRVSHVFDMINGSLRPFALAYGTVVAVAGVVLHQAGIKKHFLEAYLHAAANVLFIALLSGVGARDGSALYMAAILALSGLAIAQGIRFRRFAFVVYGVVYGYLAISYQVIRSLRNISPMLAYVVISGAAVIIGLTALARRFGRDA